MPRGVNPRDVGVATNEAPAEVPPEELLVRGTVGSTRVLVDGGGRIAGGAGTAGG